MANKVLFQKPNAELCTFCLLVDKSKEVPHPRAKRGGGEEELEAQKRLAAQVCPRG